MIPPSLFRILPVDEITVWHTVYIVFRFENFLDSGEKLIPHVIAQYRVRVGVGKGGEGYRFPVVGTIGGVQIQKKDRVPLTQDRNQPANLRRFQLQKITVEVEVLAVRTDSGQFRALVSAVFAQFLIAIGVEYGNHQQNLVIQHVRQRVQYQVTDQHQ